MKRFIPLLLLALTFATAATAKKKTVTIRLVETSDVHGSFMPYDYTNRTPKRGSLARVDTYIRNARAQHGHNVILLDNGDLLQGQPICYYYNYVATDRKNIAAEVTNFMGYDIQNIGNHDIETGHACYDKWIGETKAAVLGANIMSTATGEPYVKPYTILQRDGVKIAVLGMNTAAIPSWLAEELWSGMTFEDMLDATRKWVKHIADNEKPDLMVGLFHAGLDGGIVTDSYEENPTARIAREVPGFDIIFFGHDHSKYCTETVNNQGGKVWMLNPANDALCVADAEVTLTIDDKGRRGTRLLDKQITGKIASVEDEPLSEEFMAHFADADREVRAYYDRTIGTFTETIYTRDCFFGSNPFNDFIHNMQLALTGAQVSFTAPLSLNAKINKGELHVSDMFNLYRFENKLSTIMMTGEEIRRHLEMSYASWVTTMNNADDHIIRMKTTTEGGKTRHSFECLTFNFDSAAGIDYTVDVTKPEGSRVSILQMSDGSAFDPNAMYKVAMNSYRANGGGELLTKGAGLSKEEIERRIVWTSDLDLRHYLMLEIEKRGTITPTANHNWHFIPAEIATPALERDFRLLYPNAPLPAVNQ